MKEKRKRKRKKEKTGAEVNIHREKPSGEQRKTHKVYIKLSKHEQAKPRANGEPKIWAKGKNLQASWHTSQKQPDWAGPFQFKM